MAEESRQSGLGRAIHLRRVELGLKRAEVAKAASLSYPYISEIENGVKQPSVGALGRIAEALELSVSELAALSEQFAEDSAERTAWTPAASGPSVALANVFHASIPPTRQSSQLLRNEPPHNPPTPPLDTPELAEIVRRVVREELGRWEQERLPELVRLELLRRLDQTVGGEE